MDKQHLISELERVERALADRSEAQRIEWLRVANEGFGSPEKKREFFAAFDASAKMFAELVDEKAAIKRKLNAPQTP